MDQACAFHPTSGAEWICPECGDGFCNACIRKGYPGSKGQSSRFCPRCNVQAEWVGAANVIPPFWERLHKFFAYPLRTRTLVLNLAVSAAMLLMGMLPVAGILVRIAASLLMLRYAYEILRQTASGKLDPPEVDIRALSADIGPVLKQYVLFIALGLLAVPVTLVAGPLVLAYFIFVAAFVPAMLIVLVTTSSLRNALNPNVFVRVAYRIGWSYLLMYLFLMLLLGAPAALGGSIAGVLPDMLTVYVMHVAEFYYMFISFHLIGYVLLQHHHELGYEVSYQDLQGAELAKDTESSVASGDEERVNGLVQSGQIDEALSFLRGRLDAGRLESASLLRKYYRLLQTSNRTDEQLAVAPPYLRGLLQEGLRDEAKEVFRECLRADGGFVPDSETLFGLAETFEDSGEYKRAIELFKTLAKTYPKDRLAVHSYFRIAMLLNERLMMPDKARNILRSLQAKYPKHSLQPKIDNYLRYSLET